jgi:hypothetical protein
MKTANQIVAIVLWIIGLTMLITKASSLIGALYFVPFTLGPLALTHVGIVRATSTRAQTILLIAMLAYFAWLAFVYVDAFYIHPDPQSPIALLFVGVYALPVLALLWWAAYRAEAKSIVS